MSFISIFFFVSFFSLLITLRYLRRLLKYAIILFAFFLILCVFSSHYLNFVSNRSYFLKISLTGSATLEELEWKNPYSPITKQKMLCSQVVIKDHQEHLLGVYNIPGDQIAVKIKIMAWHPFLRFIGLKNIYQIIGLHNGYHNFQDQHTKPFIFIEINTQKPPYLKRFFWKLWEPMTNKESFFNLINPPKETSLYFPLFDEKNKPLEKTFFLKSKNFAHG
ncbi:MAG: hypothetical protein ACOVOR_00330 [Rhabdochlamydiaceae bacterium]